MEKQWSITIDDFDGFAPAWWGNKFPFTGDKTQARDMVSIDLFYANGLKQGPGISTLVDGNESGVVTTLINSILDFPPTTGVTYGIGSTLLYQLTNDLVTDTSGTWPHTITPASGTTDGEDVCYYKGDLYYSYNYTSGLGDIGKYDLSSTFDDDYMSAVPTGKTTLEGDVPHQMILGQDDKMYIANGQYVASFDGTTFVAQALDFAEGSVVSSVAWNSNRLYVAVNKTTLSGNNKNLSSIYIWDTNSTSWELEIPVSGRLGALFVKDGITYFWWEELVTDNSLYKFGYLDGTSVADISIYSESTSTTALPEYNQVTTYKNTIVWSKYNNSTTTLTYNTTVDDADVTIDDAPETIDNNVVETNTGLVAFGTSSKDVQDKLFQCMKARYPNVGAIANPFGTLMVASYTGNSYDISKSYRYTTDSRWRTIYFNVSDAVGEARIDRVAVFTEPLLLGATIDTNLVYDFGKSEISLDQITHNTDNITRHIITRNSVIVENFALDFSWANSSTVNPANIRRIEITGTLVTNK